MLRPKTSILSTPHDSVETSADVRQRVIEARRVQVERSGKANALLDAEEMAQHCSVGGATLQLLEDAVKQLYLSPRACHRILKVSRTIADMDQAADIGAEHVAEAITFRRLNASAV